MKVVMVMLASVDGKTIQGNNQNVYSWSSIEDRKHFFSLIKRNNLIIMGRLTYEASRPIIKLKKGGMILGVMQTIVPYLSDIIQLESGDTIVLFTDGITEAMNVKWEEYSDERLEAFVVDKTNLDSKRLLEEIKQSVEQFTVGAEQSDDITCMVIKVK